MNREKSIAIAVKKLTNQFHRYMNAKKAEFLVKMEAKELEPLTDAHGRILEYLSENLGKQTIYQKDVEKRFNIRRSTATVLLQRMEKSGMVYREVSAEDGRMKALILTEKAKALHPKVYAEIKKAEEQAKKGLSKADIDNFFRITEIIIKNME